MSGSAAAVLQYRQQAVLTAPPVKLVDMLYDRAIRCLGQAETALGERKYDLVGRNVGSCQAIVGELLTALNLEAGVEIARNLQRLYTFALESMMTASLEKNAARLAQVRQILGTLHEAWHEIASV